MTLDPQVSALLESINAHAPPPDGALRIDDARRGLDALFARLAGECPQGCSTADRQIVRPEGGHIPVRLYTPPAKLDRHLPAIVFFHGGGWSLGDVASYDSLMRSMCLLSGVLFISVEYRLAPEHKFPAGLADALLATRHVLHHAGTFGADPARIGVMGDSAGGNLAAVVAQKLASEEVAPAAQFLLYPSLDLDSPHERYPSRMNLGNGDLILSRQGIDNAIDWYRDGNSNLNDPALSPLNNPDIARVAPCLLMVGSHDPLLDETRAYAQLLCAAHVPCSLIEVPGAVHAFLSFGVLDLAQRYRALLADKIRLMLYS